ncbi:MAG: DUF362 domain-containing protein [Pyrinomonadaceae bacterium]
MSDENTKGDKKADDEKIFRAAPTDEDQPGERYFAQAEDEQAAREGANAKAVVAVARTTERYRDLETIHALTKEAIDYLGGIEKFVRAGQSVLIKPNQTGYFLADEGMTTDPRVVAALIRLCFDAGASRVMVAEGSGVDSTRIVMQATGMTPACQAAGAEIVYFDDCEYRETDIPRGKAIQRIALPVPLLDADVIINVCKGKTHHMDPITGAIKNWVGCIALGHGREQHHDAHCFAEYVDIMTVTKPALNICDAIIIGEGDGPVANTPRWCGCVLASTDPVAMDVTICQLFTLDHKDHQFAAEGAERGLGTNKLEEISIVGASLEEARIEVRRPRQGWDYFPFNVIVGKGVTYAGTLGHWKSIADQFLKDGTWANVIALRGVPTFLIGDAEDPDFEKHVEQGPYFVIDDAAPARYREDARVHLVPGHPALHNMLPDILKGFGLTVPGNLYKRGQEFLRAGESRLLYVPPAQVAKEVAALTLAVAGAGALAFAALRYLRGRN